LRELSREKGSDEERLDSEYADCHEQIHRERGPRCGSDARSMG
jgi:hypothetical protein